ncbi:hypothetical protein M409DRAFT_48548 [Zasmidium cellare ATCC 36951]|uniref:Uncharacterized protein n=1 Tax=Zasmidium cellare ATCC 36951 TaxID=1080233 RepID=A0A6A6D2I8_ZASCE|nr:uncharacterized protein M409DRAFT_48548 [Zasmidium cellare ATCC 36951]KAF2173591.1 hypothetical protein M409DRAFT_48548 [Zasmidium cellare ATCC 36951]
MRCTEDNVLEACDAIYRDERERGRRPDRWAPPVVLRMLRCSLAKTPRQLLSTGQESNDFQIDGQLPMKKTFSCKLRFLFPAVRKKHREMLRCGRKSSDGVVQICTVAVASCGRGYFNQLLQGHLDRFPNTRRSGGRITTESLMPSLAGKAGKCGSIPWSASVKSSGGGRGGGGSRWHSGGVAGSAFEIAAEPVGMRCLLAGRLRHGPPIGPFQALWSAELSFLFRRVVVLEDRDFAPPSHNSTDGTELGSECFHLGMFKSSNCCDMPPASPKYCRRIESSNTHTVLKQEEGCMQSIPPVSSCFSTCHHRDCCWTDPPSALCRTYTSSRLLAGRVAGEPQLPIEPPALASYKN